MREILFRGKRIDNGEWVEGYYVKALDMYDKEIHAIFDTMTTFYACGETSGFELVDPETICQYTGLTDKSGKKIWEGDILEGHLDDKFPEDVTREKVIWHESGWKTEEPGCDNKEYLDEFDTENMEVVGNAFDNPEWLEV